MSEKPVREHDKFMLRLPDGLRDRIAAAAKRRGTSMNTEIVSLLAATYPEPTPTPLLVDRAKAILEKMSANPRRLLNFEVRAALVDMINAGEEDGVFQKKMDRHDVKRLGDIGPRELRRANELEAPGDETDEEQEDVAPADVSGPPKPKRRPMPGPKPKRKGDG